MTMKARLTRYFTRKHFNLFDKMSFILTTIGRDAKVAVLECDDNEKPQKGERKISLDTLLKNVKSGLFVDVTNKCNHTGKVFILKDDLSC